MSEEATRSFQFELDFDASPDEVWRALTEPRELERWFPFEARVEPRLGGEVLWSWGGAWTWLTRIDGWEPGRRLRLVQQAERPFDLEGRPLAEGRAAPATIAMEFTLESHAGGTRLRLVHSGFGRGAAWDDELDGITTGWNFELRGLRHYLARHRGRERTVAWVAISTPLARAEAWARLTGPQGFPLAADPLAEGRPYSVAAATGDRFRGRLLVAMPEGEVAGTVEDLDDGIFRVHAWRAAGETGVGVFLASWGGGAERVRAFEARARTVVLRLFPGSPDLRAAPASPPSPAGGA